VLAALIIGVFTAWYLGLRAGVVAAAASAVALLVATVVPGATITVYVVLVGWVGLLYFYGKHLAGLRRPSGKASPGLGGAGWKAEVGKWALRARALWTSRK